MFGIDLDKLLLVGILVGLIVGPARLRDWSRKLPQIVGRVHALYRQGRADVTKNLDDLAPEWRDYDPRQFHPRRILRDLGEDVQRSAQGAEAGAGPAVRAGESPVELSFAAHRDLRDRDDRGVGGDADHVPDSRQSAQRDPHEAPGSDAAPGGDGGQGSDGAPGGDGGQGSDDATPGSDAAPGGDAAPGSVAAPGSDAGSGGDAAPGSDAVPGSGDPRL